MRSMRECLRQGPERGPWTDGDHVVAGHVSGGGLPFPAE